MKISNAVAAAAFAGSGVLLYLLMEEKKKKAAKPGTKVCFKCPVCPAPAAKPQSAPAPAYPTCPSGQYYDLNQKKCVPITVTSRATPSCPQYQIWNPSTQSCYDAFNPSGTLTAEATIDMSQPSQPSQPSGPSADASYSIDSSGSASVSAGFRW